MRVVLEGGVPEILQNKHWAKRLHAPVFQTGFTRRCLPPRAASAMVPDIWGFYRFLHHILTGLGTVTMIPPLFEDALERNIYERSL